MLTVYCGSGARDYDIGERVLTEDQWAAFRRGAVGILKARGYKEAADLLGTLPFEIVQGVNFFGDEFVVLLASVHMDRYVEIVEKYRRPESRGDFRPIASALNEVAPFYVRFIAFDTDLEAGLPPVQEPELRVTNRTVEEALGDARHLISGRGSTSGVDRAHTAFHGYLRMLCEDACITVAEEADVTKLFRALRDQHPAIQVEGTRSGDISQALRALAAIVNVLNPLRNRATLVHPNAELLAPAEADLVLNCIHTLLHYLNRKLN